MSDKCMVEAPSHEHSMGNLNGNASPSSTSLHNYGKKLWLILKNPPSTVHTHTTQTSMTGCSGNSVHLWIQYSVLP